MNVGGMKHLCIQVQPHRAVGIDTAGVCGLCHELAESSAEIKRFGAFEGNDEEDYINLMFETRSVPRLWELLKEKLYGDPIHGPGLRGASMAMCQGAHGWDDYLQLYHFDPAVILDKLTNR